MTTVPAYAYCGRMPHSLSVPEAAKMLGLAESTLRHQIKNGKLQARKVSRDWYLTPEEVERYRLQNRRTDGGA